MIRLIINTSTRSDLHPHPTYHNGSCVADYQQRERARLRLEQEGLARRRAALAQMDREAQTQLRDAEVRGVDAWTWSTRIVVGV